MSGARSSRITRVEFRIYIKTQRFCSFVCSEPVAQNLAGTQCGTGSEKKQNLHSGVRKKEGGGGQRLG